MSDYFVCFGFSAMIVMFLIGIYNYFTNKPHVNYFLVCLSLEFAILMYFNGKMTGYIEGYNVGYREGRISIILGR